jgi:hypothetical protein
MVSFRLRQSPLLPRFTCRDRSSRRRGGTLEPDRTLERRLPGSLARRDSAQARSGKYGAGRGCFLHCNRRRAAAQGAQFCAARSSRLVKTLSFHQPFHGRSCLARGRGSRAFRRLRNFPRSRKRKRFSPRWRHEPIKPACDFGLAGCCPYRSIDRCVASRRTGSDWDYALTTRRGLSMSGRS